MLVGRFDAVRLTLVALCVTVLSLLSVPADAQNGEAASKQLAQRLCNNRYNPVCGTTGGRRRTFTNLCRARRAAASNIRSGRCPAASTCGNQYRPVCGYKNGRWTNFRNACWARRASANPIRDGVCRTPIRTCHQRGTSRRYPHIAGRSWNPACRVAPIRTCHQRGTSRRYPHIAGRSWNPACRVGVVPPPGGGAPPPGGGGPAPKKVGGPCVGRDHQGVTFNGQWAADQRGDLNCIAGGGAR